MTLWQQGQKDPKNHLKSTFYFNHAEQIDFMGKYFPQLVSYSKEFAKTLFQSVKL